VRRLALVAATTVFLLAACATDDDSSSPTTDGSTIDAPASPENSQSQGSTTGEVRLIPVAEIPGAVDVTSRFGDDALYVVSRTGTVTRILDGNETIVLDVADLTSTESERGLLGLAFSPDGARAYANYTDSRGDTVIAEFNVDQSGAITRSSLRILLTIDQPYSNHNGGDLVVANDGTLLVAMGDGGSGGDPERVSLDDTSLLGKVVRIDPRNGATSLVARGLRNPWRIDLYDDDLWLADVGQNEIEEVNVLRDVSAMAEVVSFGWSAFEGPKRFNDDQPADGHLEPLVWYEHGDDGCSVSGGAVAVSGALAGRYVFGDYCSGRIWSIDAGGRDTNRLLHLEDVSELTAVARAHDDLYVLSLQGDVLRIES
jgi:glucose/arabinose dehydrogenase